MGNVSSTILALLLLQVFAAAGWALAARHLGLSRREAAHWSGFSLLMAAVLGLTLARGSAPDWLTYEVCSLLAVLALIFRVSGPRGLATSIAESADKYAAVRWLQEIGRSITAFKFAGSLSLIHI